jgi:hypothetical protein
MCAIINTAPLRVDINPTCGFHVYVGNGFGRDEKRFDFSTVQNLMAIIWTFEDQTESLHPEHRRNNIYCRTLHEGSCLGGNTQYQGLGNIYCQKDLAELRWVLNSHNHFDAYNIKHVVDERSSTTTEFRRHAGTIDPDEVASWVILVVRLVEVARGYDSAKLEACLYRFVVREERGTKLITSQFITHFLGFLEVAEYYEEKSRWGKVGNHLSNVAGEIQLGTTVSY